VRESTILKPKEILYMKRIIQIILLAIAPFYALAQWTTSGTTITGQVGSTGALTLDLRATTNGGATLALSPASSGAMGTIRANNYGGAPSALTFQTNTLERMRIGENGIVTVGTVGTAPNLFQVNYSIHGSTYGGSIKNANSGNYALTDMSLYNDINSRSQFFLTSSTFNNSYVSQAIIANTTGITAQGTGGVALVSSEANASIKLATNSLERMRINGNGNVGIGTTAPTEKFEIFDTNNTATRLKISNTNGGSSAHSSVVVSSNGASAEFFARSSAPGGVGELGPNKAGISSSGTIALITTGSSSPINFAPNFSAKMTVMPDGNVGIGTLSPSAKLNVHNAGAPTQVIIGNPSTATGGFTSLLMGTSADTNGFGYIEAVKSSGASYGDVILSRWGGSVGIGTTTPDGFQVNSPIGNENSSNTNNVRIGVMGGTPRILLDKAGSTPFEIDNAGGQLRIFNPGAVRLVVNSNGFVGIGTASPDEALTVRGKIHTNEVRVDLLGAVAPDYVFEPTYDLKPLAEIETYIKENKHLPEVPSAKEMEKNGVQLGEMNMLLLKKVEELTLHLIELKKENDLLKVRVEKMEVKK
jgi:hypothetical protein